MRSNGVLAGLGHAGVEADHVFTMTDVPHYFALRGFDAECAFVERFSVDSIEETVAAAQRQGETDAVATAQLRRRL